MSDAAKQLAHIRSRPRRHDGLSASARRELRALAAAAAWAATANALLLAAGGSATLQERDIVSGLEPEVRRNGDGTVTLTARRKE